MNSKEVTEEHIVGRYNTSNPFEVAPNLPHTMALIRLDFARAQIHTA